MAGVSKELDHRLGTADHFSSCQPSPSCDFEHQTNVVSRTASEALCLI